MTVREEPHHHTTENVDGENRLDEYYCLHALFMAGLSCDDEARLTLRMNEQHDEGMSSEVQALYSSGRQRMPSEACFIRLASACLFEGSSLS